MQHLALWRGSAHDGSQKVRKALGLVLILVGAFVLCYGLFFLAYWIRFALHQCPSCAATAQYSPTYAGGRLVYLSKGWYPPSSTPEGFYTMVVDGNDIATYLLIGGAILAAGCLTFPLERVQAKLPKIKPPTSAQLPFLFLTALALAAFALIAKNDFFSKQDNFGFLRFDVYSGVTIYLGSHALPAGTTGAEVMVFGCLSLFAYSYLGSRSVSKSALDSLILLSATAFAFETALGFGVSFADWQQIFFATQWQFDIPTFVTNEFVFWSSFPTMSILLALRMFVVTERRRPDSR